MNEYIDCVKYKLQRAESSLDEAIRNYERHDTIYWKGYVDGLKSVLKVLEN